MLSVRSLRHAHETNAGPALQTLPYFFNSFLTFFLPCLLSIPECFNKKEFLFVIFVFVPLDC